MSDHSRSFEERIARVANENNKSPSLLLRDGLIAYYEKAKELANRGEANEMQRRILRESWDIRLGLPFTYQEVARIPLIKGKQAAKESQAATPIQLTIVSREEVGAPHLPIPALAQTF
jgi:hypothetical protein